ncbi:MAG: transposase [Bacteroidales bacterium]|nr:transposase [Bacteroidales bacterium]
MKSKRKFSSEFKAKVAIEALKEQSTLSELAIKYQLTPNQISQWKKEFLEKAPQVFAMKTPEKSHEDEVNALYKKIGELQIANDFFANIC